MSIRTAEQVDQFGNAPSTSSVRNFRAWPFVLLLLEFTCASFQTQAGKGLDALPGNSLSMGLWQRRGVHERPCQIRLL